jgi:hypothetical protein
MKRNERKAEEWSEINKFVKRLLDILEQLKVLDSKGKEVLIRYYGIGQDSETLDEISKSFGVSRTWIQAIRNKATRRVRFFTEGKRIFVEVEILEGINKISQQLNRIEGILAPQEPVLAIPKETLSMPIRGLDLSVRSTNCLEYAGVFTVGDLIQKTERELLMTKNMGRRSLAEIQEALSKLNLQLKG